MKQRPILMSGPLVREILAGNKTQTRRPIKALKEMDPNSINLLDDEIFFNTIEFDRKENGHVFHILSKYGEPGDQLWIRETFSPIFLDPSPGIEVIVNSYVYSADFKKEELKLFKWKPSIFMPKEASRITLEIEEIQVERLQDITEEDAKAEGVIPDPDTHPDDCPYLVSFEQKWIEIYGQESLDSNPWVWVIKFKVIDS